MDEENALFYYDCRCIYALHVQKSSPVPASFFVPGVHKVEIQQAIYSPGTLVHMTQEARQD